MAGAKRRAVACALVALGAVAAYGGYWNWAAASARAGIEGWIAARRAEGWQVGHGAITAAGFPFTISLRIDEPHLVAPRGAWSWRGTALVARARPWSLGAVVVALPHENALAAGGRAAALTLAEGRAELAFERGRLRAWRARLEDAALAEGGAELRLASLEAAGDGAARLELDARGIELPEQADGPLGRRVESLALALAAEGRLGTGPTALAAWRDAGGVVEVERLALRWGEASLEADGTLALDAEMRPLGAFAARVSGWGAVLEGLVANGALAPANAALTKTLLDLMAKPDEAGRPVVEVPVTAQDGRLEVGPLTVLRFGPLPLGRSGLLGLDDAATDRSGAGEELLEEGAVAVTDRPL